MRRLYWKDEWVKQKKRETEKLIDWRNTGNRLSGDSPILVATIRPPIRPRASTIKKSVSWFFSKWFAADSPAIPAPTITILHLTLSSSVFFVDSAMIMSYQLSVAELTWLVNFYSKRPGGRERSLLIFARPSYPPSPVTLSSFLEIHSKFFDVSHFLSRPRAEIYRGHAKFVFSYFRFFTGRSFARHDSNDTQDGPFNTRSANQLKYKVQGIAIIQRGIQTAINMFY